jgi:hypothetical protein
MKRNNMRFGKEECFLLFLEKVCRVESNKKRGKIGTFYNLLGKRLNVGVYGIMLLL